MAGMGPTAGRAQAAPDVPRKTNFAGAADFAYRKGAHGTLPPHLSTLLGLTKEQETQLMQGVVRTGSRVQVLGVSIKDKNDVVLFDVDEGANDRTLFLTSPEGGLRKVVVVKAGVGEVAPMTDEMRAAFETQKKFWVARVAGATMK